MWIKLNSLILPLYTRLQMLRDEKAQAMVEYTLILALLSVVAVATIALVGKKIETTWLTIEKKF
jgi:Flp pilus assembly pilin Flp